MSGSVYQPRFVYSAAETLSDLVRQEIESQFNGKAFDYYGPREAGSITGKCRFGRRHVFTMNNVVEIPSHRDDSGRGNSSGLALRPAQPMTRQGEEALPAGPILVTKLHNKALPLIRYEIGDTGMGRGLVHGEYFTHLFSSRAI